MDDQTATRPPQPPTPAGDGGTKYLVLRELGETADGLNEQWETVNFARARTAEKAIEQAVGKLPEEEQAGTFVAVAVSRWTPMLITPKVERSLILKAVK